MKYKKLLFSTLFMFGGIALAISLMSSNSGMPGASTGCGTSSTGCHGVSANSTTIALTGVPTGGYMADTTYTLTLTVTNPDSLLTHGGFTLATNAGVLSAAPANTTITSTGTTIHHTSKKMKSSSSSVSWTFNWKAPAVNSTVINVAGNMVNGTQTFAGDKWNTVVITLQQSPTSVANLSSQNVTIYPNPCVHELLVKLNAAVKGGRIVNMFGQTIQALSASPHVQPYTISTYNLPTGNYILMLETENGIKRIQFSKQ